jgi:hypothetical protein
MSHSSSFQIPGYDGDVVVIHNGDWSGDATVVFKEAVFGSWDKKEKLEQRVEIPAKLLVALALPVAKEFVLSEIVRTIEQIDVSKSC